MFQKAWPAWLKALATRVVENGLNQGVIPHENICLIRSGTGKSIIGQAHRSLGVLDRKALLGPVGRWRFEALATERMCGINRTPYLFSAHTSARNDCRLPALFPICCVGIHSQVIDPP
jgi:hypothetical protein